MTRIRPHIDERFPQDSPLPEILEELARHGAQLLLHAALATEVTGFLGRERAQDNQARSRGGIAVHTAESWQGLTARLLRRSM